MRKVYEWDTGRYLGEIPEVAHTYATIGNMNEHGLAISESTWGGREEYRHYGIVDYGSLIYITLQRAKTAREAIKVMTDLVRDYGYYSSGESFSIADGKGLDNGDDRQGRQEQRCSVGCTPHPRRNDFGTRQSCTHTPFPLKDKETLYSPDVIDFARSQGYFDGKDEDFDFSKAYAITDFGALRGCDARVWSFFDKHAKGMDECTSLDNERRGRADAPVGEARLGGRCAQHAVGYARPF